MFAKASKKASGWPLGSRHAARPLAFMNGAFGSRVYSLCGCPFVEPRERLALLDAMTMIPWYHRFQSTNRFRDMTDLARSHCSQPTVLVLYDGCTVVVQFAARLKNLEMAANFSRQKPVI